MPFKSFTPGPCSAIGIPAFANAGSLAVYMPSPRCLVQEQHARNRSGARVRALEVRDVRLGVTQHDGGRGRLERIGHLVRVRHANHVGALGQAGEGVLPAVGRGGRGFRRARQDNVYAVKTRALDAHPAADAGRAEERAVKGNVGGLAERDCHVHRSGPELDLVGVIPGDRDRVGARLELREGVEPTGIGDVGLIFALAGHGDGHACKAYALDADLTHDARGAEIRAVEADDLRLAHADRGAGHQAAEADLVAVESGDLDRVGAGPKACKRILAVHVGGGLCFGHAGKPDRNAPETRVLDRYRPSFGCRRIPAKRRRFRRRGSLARPHPDRRFGGLPRLRAGASKQHVGGEYERQFRRRPDP